MVRLLSLFCLLLLFVFPFTVKAGGFQLTSIGSLDVTGALSSEWWYTTANPTLSGQTTQNGTVEVTIDGSTQTVTADGNGNWSAPTSIADGDHTVSLISNGSTISFTLHITPTVPDTVGSPQVSEVPVAGTAWPTITLVGFSALLFTSGLYIHLKFRR